MGAFLAAFLVVSALPVPFVPQDKDGFAKGGMSYTDQWGETQ